VNVPHVVMVIYQARFMENHLETINLAHSYKKKLARYTKNDLQCVEGISALIHSSFSRETCDQISVNCWYPLNSIKKENSI
jgi:hypothetical protein